MKRVIIVHNYSKISYNGMSYALANSLANDCKVLFISHLRIEKDLRIANSNLQVVNWPSNNFFTLKTQIWLIKLLFNFKPNIVLGHFRGGMLVGFIAKFTTFFRVKNIQYYHTNFLTYMNVHDLKKNKIKLLRLRYKIFYTIFCDLVICPSEFSKKDIQKFFNVKNVKVIHNGLYDYYCKNEKSKDIIKVGFLGRFDENKGVFILIKAYKEYINLYPNSIIKLFIAGYGSKENITIIDEMIKGSNIENCGSMDYDNVMKFFSSINYSIVPSILDNLPTTGIESLMQGTPISITNNNGLAELIIDSINSFSIEHSEKSIIDWFKKIENFDNYSEMSNQARQVFLNYFSVDQNVDKVKQLIINK